LRPDEYWKNFNLGTELDIAGRILFNGLQAFHEMEHFAAEEDSFEFLYSVAVGIDPRRPKYTIPAERIPDGQGFKFTADQVALLLQ